MQLLPRAKAKKKKITSGSSFAARNPVLFWACRDFASHVIGGIAATIGTHSTVLYSTYSKTVVASTADH